MQIIVRDNNIDQALKALKKKMQREGIFREMKLRGAYEKPSEKRARERAARRQETGKRSDQPARLIEGQRVTGWREALNELAVAYPGRIR